MRLPLQRNLRLAVLGPLRNATEELLGNYQAWGKVADGSLSLLPSCSILQAWPVHVISPVEGLKKVPKWMEGTPNFGATFHTCGLGWFWLNQIAYLAVRFRAPAYAPVNL